MALPSTRPLRYCDVCGQLDDHPRHVKSISRKTEKPLHIDETYANSLKPGTPRSYMELMNPWVTVRHMDCCAAQGCAECYQTEKDNRGRRGQKLIDHLMNVVASRVGI
jgi:hypothetical protein